MNDEDKKQKIGVSINEKLNELLEKEMLEKGIKKSQIIEKAIKTYMDSLEENELTEKDLEKLIKTFIDKF
ncbi:MAG: ribbon-helix-helix domain-containing protein [Saccharofermentanales bacterium]